MSRLGTVKWGKTAAPGSGCCKISIDVNRQVTVVSWQKPRSRRRFRLAQKGGVAVTAPVVAFKVDTTG